MLRKNIKPKSQPQFNYRVAAENLLFGQTLVTFQDDVPQLFQKLILAMDEDDRLRVRALAHSIKGSLGFLETTDAQAYFQNLEDCAEETDRELLEQKFGECRVRLDKVMSEITSKLP